jgi:tetratricopeptide (TPR) repeat protein
MDQTQLQAHLRNNTLEHAVGELEREYASAVSTGARAQAALVTNDLGVVLSLLGRNDEARAKLQKAREMFNELNDPAGQGRAIGNLAQLEEQSGNAELAGALFMQAADLLHDGNALAEEFATRKRLSRYYIARGATLQALSENTRALSVKPDASAWDRV